MTYKKKLKTSRAQLKAGAKYDAANTVTFSIKLNLKTDEQLVKYLKSCSNKQAAIKAALTSYIKNQVD